jgi:hypothetical protein
MVQVNISVAAIHKSIYELIMITILVGVSYRNSLYLLMHKSGFVKYSVV